MTTPQTLPWSVECPDGRFLHIVRYCLRSGQGWPHHRHDFHEVFWLESGTLRHAINGQNITLHAGDVCFIRAHDEHLASATAEGATFINLSFHPGPVQDLPQRYAGLAWPWLHPDPLPFTTHLSPRRMERLHTWADDLSSRQGGRIDLECFLLDLVRLVARPAEHDRGQGLPAWLRDALEVFADECHLAGGTAKLAHLCGRSQAHLNRVVQEAQGRTTTELVNELRLTWVAASLRMSDRRIADLATSCGLPHLGHFYRLFFARFGTTPRGYRMAAQQVGMGRAW